MCIYYVVIVWNLLIIIVEILRLLCIDFFYFGLLINVFGELYIIFIFLLRIFLLFLLLDFINKYFNRFWIFGKCFCKFIKNIMMLYNVIMGILVILRGILVFLMDILVNYGYFG